MVLCRSVDTDQVVTAEILYNTHKLSQLVNQHRNQFKMSESTEKFDATGLNCPLPILRAKKVLTSMNSGEVLYVIATDSGSVKDFDAFCKQTGNELLDSSEADGKYHYHIKKA